MQERFIGLDLHKEYAVLIGVNKALEIVLQVDYLAVQKLAAWGEKNLLPTDQIVLEVTVNSWHVYDILAPLVDRVLVVHPPHIPLITGAHVKTDYKASVQMAQLLAAGILESVWIPDSRTRRYRKLIAQRNIHVKEMVKAKNRLHAVLHRLNIKRPSDGMFHAHKFDWWEEHVHDVTEQVVIRADLHQIDMQRELQKQIEKALKREAAEDERMIYLIQLPGVGYLSACTILAGIGDISRFESAKKLSGYAGLGVRVYSSGKRHATGRITKAGRFELRRAMVQAAHAAGRYHPFWKKQLEDMRERMRYQKAVTAIARKLLVSVWHVLTRRELDRHAIPKQVARRVYIYVNDLGAKNREKGVTAPMETRRYLDILNVAQDVEFIQWTKERRVELPN